MGSYWDIHSCFGMMVVVVGGVVVVVVDVVILVWILSPVQMAPLV